MFPPGSYAERSALLLHSVGKKVHLSGLAKKKTAHIGVSIPHASTPPLCSTPR